MIELAAGMMIASGAIHAVVNAVLKSGGDKLSSRALIDMSSAAVVLPAVFLVPLPHGAWGWLAASLIVHGIYFISVVRAFESADMSTVYPIMRGTAPVLAAAGGVLVLGDEMSVEVAAGVALVCIGIFVSAFGRSMNCRAFAWSLLVGLCIAAYTVIDAAGVRAAPSPLSYIVWAFLVLGGVLGLFFAAFRSRSLVAYARTNWRSCVVAGVLSVLTYGLAMGSYAYGAVPRLAALRESSILFAMVIAALFLGESMNRQRVFAGAAIFAGVAALILLR